MGRETVAQRMRRDPIAEAEPHPCRLHRAADHLGGQRAATGAAKQDFSRSGSIGAQRDISLDRFPNRAQQRHDPGLGALAGDDQRIAERHYIPGQRHRLADPQTGAIEQQQHRLVARGNPRLGGGLGGILGDRADIVRRHRARHAPLDAGPLDLDRLGRAFALGDEIEEIADRRKLARCGNIAEPFPAPLGQEAAQITAIELRKQFAVNHRATMPANETDQPVRGRQIGADGMFGSPPIAAQMLGPQQREVAGRMVVEG